MRNIVFFFNLFFPFIICLLPKKDYAQKDSVRQVIEQLMAEAKGKVGVAYMDMETKDTLIINGDVRYPMQSVYKFPLAMAVLDQVDKGAFSLNQNISVLKKDLLPNTHSPLRDKYPDGNVVVPLSELLSYAVSKSDNNACDILFRLVGGPSKVETYIHYLGAKQIAITATEEEMHKSWDIQYTNWCEPFAMLQLLDFLHSRYLSKTSSDFLWKIMTETSTGPKRIKGLLPQGTLVAHKTGTSNTNEKGITAATNDVGIVALSNLRNFAVAVFVSDSPENESVREGVIAKITKVLWDYTNSEDYIFMYGQ